MDVSGGGCGGAACLGSRFRETDTGRLQVVLADEAGSLYVGDNARALEVVRDGAIRFPHAVHADVLELPQFAAL